MKRFFFLLSSLKFFFFLSLRTIKKYTSMKRARVEEAEEDDGDKEEFKSLLEQVVQVKEGGGEAEALTATWLKVCQGWRRFPHADAWAPRVRHALYNHFPWALGGIEKKQHGAWDFLGACCGAWKTVCPDPNMEPRLSNSITEMLCEVVSMMHGDGDHNSSALLACVDLLCINLLHGDQDFPWGDVLLAPRSLFLCFVDVIGNSATSELRGRLREFVACLVPRCSREHVIAVRKMCVLLAKWAISERGAIPENMLVALGFALDRFELLPEDAKFEKFIETLLLRVPRFPQCFDECGSFQAHLRLWVSALQRMCTTGTRFCCTGVLDVMTFKFLRCRPRDQCSACWETVVDVLTRLAKHDARVAAAFIARDGPVTMLRQAIARTSVYARQQSLDLLHHFLDRAPEFEDGMMVLTMLVRSRAVFMEDLRTLVMLRDQCCCRVKARVLFARLLRVSGMICVGLSWDFMTSGAVSALVEDVITADTEDMSVSWEVREEAGVLRQRMAAGRARLDNGPHPALAVVAHQEYGHIWEVAAKPSHVADICSQLILSTDCEDFDAGFSCTEALKAWFNVRMRLWTGFRIVDHAFLKLIGTIFSSDLFMDFREERPLVARCLVRAVAFAPSADDRRAVLTTMQSCSGMSFDSTMAYWDVLDLLDFAPVQEKCKCARVVVEDDNSRKQVRRLPCGHFSCGICLFDAMLEHRHNQDTLACDVCGTKIIPALRPMMDLCDRVLV